MIILASFNTFALSPQFGLAELKNAYDVLNYSVNVEWDQKDRAFYDQKVNEFHKSIRNLQEQGLSNANLIEFLKQNIKDKKLASSIDDLYETIDANSMTSTEARKLALEYMSKNYSNGASWRRYDTAGFMTVALFISLSLLAVGTIPADGRISSRRCVEEYVCDEYYDNLFGFFYEDCYYDRFCY